MCLVAGATLKQTGTFELSVPLQVETTMNCCDVKELQTHDAGPLVETSNFLLLYFSGSCNSFTTRS